VSHSIRRLRNRIEYNDGLFASPLCVDMTSTKPEIQATFVERSVKFGHLVLGISSRNWQADIPTDRHTHADHNTLRPYLGAERKKKVGPIGRNSSRCWQQLSLSVKKPLQKKISCLIKCHHWCKEYWSEAVYAVFTLLLLLGNLD